MGTTSCLGVTSSINCCGLGGDCCGMGIGGGTGPVQVGGLAGAILGPGGVPGVIGPGGLARVIGPGGLTGVLNGVVHGDQASTLVVPGPDGVATTAPIVTPVVPNLGNNAVMTTPSTGCSGSCCGGVGGSQEYCGCGNGLNGSSCGNCCYPNNFGLGMDTMGSQGCCSCGGPGVYNGNAQGCCCDSMCGGQNMNYGLNNTYNSNPPGCCVNCCTPNIPYYGQSEAYLMPQQPFTPPVTFSQQPIIRPRIPPPMPRPPIVHLPTLPLSIPPPPLLNKPHVTTQPYLTTNDFITNDF